MVCVAWYDSALLALFCWTKNAAATPTATTADPATAAVRRTAVPMFARTIIEPGPIRVSGQVAHRARGVSSTGASSAKAATNSSGTSMVLRGLVSSNGADTRLSTAKYSAVTSDAMPSSQRSGVITRWSTAASRRASIGATRPARQALTAEPSSADSRPVAKPASTGHQVKPTVNQPGAFPEVTA